MAALLTGLATSNVAGAGDTEDLRRLLHDFLANADTVAAHERFWSDELVYTSAAGLRTDKAAILESLRAVAPKGDAPDTAYTAEDVDIRVYGATAVVAFRLVARPGVDGAERTAYFNTGTFVQRHGEWRAVAWQATRIPERVSGDGR